MKKLLLHTIMLLFVLLGFDSAQAQTPQSPDYFIYQSADLNFFRSISNHKPSRAAFRLMPAGTYSNAANSRFSLAAAANPVTGSGFAGRIAKWAGVIGTNTFVLGNSSITEDKFGKVGIGTDAPTSPLTVAGLIETTSPGGGIKFADGTIQTTSATGALFSLPHDLTLTGNGTAASPLGVAVPLALIGAAPDAIIIASNSSVNGDGVTGVAGPGDITTPGGSGVKGVGGSNSASGGVGGDGVSAVGGNGSNNSGVGGAGVVAMGGNTTVNTGGAGVVAIGGNDSGAGEAGHGVRAIGGNSDSGIGGAGIFATGGFGSTGQIDAGFFAGNVRVQGDVDITGMLSKGGGSFKIDHPLDPENRYLYHSFVESPDMMNIYNGNVTTDARGEAEIQLPDYFEALNSDFRYQLTVIGTFAQAIVAEEIKGNRFVIKTSAPGVKVSWQVTGIRQDEWANHNRIKVEVEKTERERGYYLHPEAFDQPEERGIVWARHPEMMKQRKEARERAKQKQQ